MTAASAAITIIPFADCPDPLDADGRASWACVLALQAHVQVARLSAEVRHLRTMAIECATCGGQPCANPSFCAACAMADDRPQRQSPSSRIPENWDEMSLDALWHHFNSNRGTPPTTIEAIKQAVRDRGVTALDEPATEQRLRSCDVAGLAEIDCWLSEKGFSR